MPNKVITDIFTSFQNYLINEQDIRDVSVAFSLFKQKILLEAFVGDSKYN